MAISQRMNLQTWSIMWCRHLFMMIRASWDAWSWQEELLKTITDRVAAYDIVTETSDMSCESSG